MNVLLASRVRVPIGRCHIRPVVTIVASKEVLVGHGSLRVNRRLAVRATRVLVIHCVLVRRHRLATTSSHAGIARPVVVTCALVLMMKVKLANLNDVRRCLALVLFVETGRDATATNNCRLITVREGRAVFTGDSRSLPIGLTSGTFNNVLCSQGAVFVYR